MTSAADRLAGLYFEPHALDPGDGRPLVTVADALTVLSEIEDEHAVTWQSWKEQMRRADAAEAEMDRLRAARNQAEAEQDALAAYLKPIKAERDRMRTVVEGVLAELASEEMEPDEWSEVAGVVRDVVTERDRLREMLAVDDLDKFIREQGPDFAALVKIRQVEAERDRERDRADRNATLVGVHDPTGEDHLREMMEHAERADAAEAERDRLRAVAFMLYRTLSDESIETIAWLSPDQKELLAQVVEVLSPRLETERAETAMQRLRAENNRLRAVVEAAKGTITTIRADIGKWAVTGTRRLAPVAAYDQLAAVGKALNAVEAQLDVSGITGGGVVPPVHGRGNRDPLPVFTKEHDEPDRSARDRSSAGGASDV